MCVFVVIVILDGYVQQERRPRRLRKENLPPSGDANHSDFLSFFWIVLIYPEWSLQLVIDNIYFIHIDGGKEIPSG